MSLEAASGQLWFEAVHGAWTDFSVSFFQIIYSFAFLLLMFRAFFFLDMISTSHVSLNAEWTLYEQVAIAAMDCQQLEVAKVNIFFWFPEIDALFILWDKIFKNIVYRKREGFFFFFFLLLFLKWEKGCFWVNMNQSHNLMAATVWTVELS